jgi:O-antigen/teichoic acid export membrane protein
VAHKKTKEIALTALYAAIINAVSHLLLVQWIGLNAAAVSSLLGYGAMAVYRYYHSRKYLTIKFSAPFSKQIFTVELKEIPLRI